MEKFTSTGMAYDIEKGVNIIGLMSGTSLDGLDMCYTRFWLERSGKPEGEWKYEIIRAEDESYPDEQAAEVPTLYPAWTAGEAVEMDYFSDALFIGDSRTDGLRLYSGIKGADFYCYKGLTIFEMDSKEVIELEGGKYTVVDALARGKQYKKIYISLGINELGYYNDDAFHNTFASFLEKVRELLPDAVISL